MMIYLIELFNWGEVYLRAHFENFDVSRRVEESAAEVQDSNLAMRQVMQRNIQKTRENRKLG